MNFAASRRFVSANRKQRNVNVVTVADFLEPGEISTVPAVKNRAPIRGDHKPAEIAMQIRKETGAPVMTRCERNLERPELDRLPIIEFVDNVKTKVVDQISNTHRHNNRLIRGNASQRAPVEMIEMRMRNQHKIN